MAKRKNECSLDNAIAGFLKKRKYRKTLKLFGSNVRNDGDLNSKFSDRFENFLKRKIKYGLKNEDGNDLGFVINFGAFQPTQKVIPNYRGLIITSEFSIQQQSVFIPMRKNRKKLSLNKRFKFLKSSLE